MDAWTEELREEEKFQKLVKATEKYEILRCEYNAKQNIENCAITGVYMATGFDAIERCIPIGLNSSSCLYSQFCGLIGQNLYGWPPLICDIDPDDVVFGIEQKAVNAIIGVEEVFDCNLIFVASGCSSDIIGTDMGGIVIEAKKKLRKAEVAYAETGGFKGNTIDGYEFVLNSLVNQIMEEPKEKWRKTVNLLGVFPTYDLYWEGNIKEIKRILEKLGIKVHCCLTGDCDLERIKNAPQASLNVVLSGIMGLKAASLMEEKFEVPYISAQKYVPIGFEGTTKFISSICEVLEVKGYEGILKEEEERTKRRIAKYIDVVSDLLLQSAQFAVRATQDVALGLLNFLGKEMGWTPYVIGLTRYNDKVIEVLEDNLDELINPLIHPKVKVLLEPDDQTMRVALLEYKPAWIFGTSMELEVQDRLLGETRLIEVTYPCMRKYTVYPRAIMGYEGAIMFIDEIMNNWHIP